MIRQNKFLSLIAFFNLIYFSHNWPNGAPESVCDTLIPKHGNNQPKLASLSPFVITQSQSTYKAGERVQVYIQAPQNYSFKGLMVQAYNPTNYQFIGSFSPGQGLKKINTCSAITHTDRKGKRSATLIWQPDDSAQSGQVAFRATIVQHFNNIFADINAILDSKK